MKFIEWVDQVWQAISRWRNSIDPNTRMDLEFTANDIAQQWGSSINSYTFEYLAITDALQVLRQCHLVRLTTEFMSPFSKYELTSNGVHLLGQPVSVAARSITDDVQLTEEESRFLQTAVLRSEEIEGTQAKRNELTAQEVFEILNWINVGNVPVRTRRLMDRLSLLQLVETDGPSGTPLDLNIGPEYDFTPSYKACLWYTQYYGQSGSK